MDLMLALCSFWYRRFFTSGVYYAAADSALSHRYNRHSIVMFLSIWRQRCPLSAVHLAVFLFVLW